MKTSKFSRIFQKFSNAITKGTGKPIAFILAFVVIVSWAITGPIFHFSDTWQLVINTGTTIITFLMVFVIQHSQNKDTMALHLKLNELLASNKKTSNRLICSETLPEEELDVLKKYYEHLSCRAKEGKDLYAERSIDEAEKRHLSKHEDNF